MLTGWASARFGILGLEAQAVTNPVLNDIGVAIATVALLVFAFVKPTVGKSEGPARGKKGGLLEDEHDAAYAGLYSAVDDLDRIASVNDAAGAEGGVVDAEADWTDKLSPANKTIFGFSASVVAGLLYGCNFNPPGEW